MHVCSIKRLKRHVFKHGSFKQKQHFRDLCSSHLSRHPTSGEYYNNENPPVADAHKKDISCLSETNDVNILL